MQLDLKIPKARAAELGWKVRQALEKSKPLKQNISKTDRQAIKLQLDDNSIIILPADKSNATVVIDRMEYSILTLKTERTLSQILSKNKHLIPQKNTDS